MGVVWVWFESDHTCNLPFKNPAYAPADVFSHACTPKWFLGVSQLRAGEDRSTNFK